MRKNRLWGLLLLLALCLSAQSLAEGFTCEPPAQSQVEPGDTLRYTLAWTGAAEALRVCCTGQTVDANSIRVTAGSDAQIVNGTDGFAVLAPSCGALQLTFDTTVAQSEAAVACSLHIGAQSYTIEHTVAHAPTATPLPTAQPAEQEVDKVAGETSIWGYIALGAVVLGFAYGIWRQKTAPQRMAKRRAKQEAKQAGLQAQLNASEQEKE